MLRHRGLGLLGLPIIKIWNMYLPRRTCLSTSALYDEAFFTVKYVPGENAFLLDALSRLYGFEAPGTVQASLECVEHDPLRMSAPDSSGTSYPAVLSAPVLLLILIFHRMPHVSK